MGLILTRKSPMCEPAGNGVSGCGKNPGEDTSELRTDCDKPESEECDARYPNEIKGFRIADIIQSKYDFDDFDRCKILIETDDATISIFMNPSPMKSECDYANVRIMYSTSHFSYECAFAKFDEFKRVILGCITNAGPENPLRSILALRYAIAYDAESGTKCLKINAIVPCGLCRMHKGIMVSASHIDCVRNMAEEFCSLTREYSKQKDEKSQELQTVCDIEALSDIFAEHEKRLYKWHRDWIGAIYEPEKGKTLFEKSELHENRIKDIENTISSPECKKVLVRFGIDDIKLGDNALDLELYCNKSDDTKKLVVRAVNSDGCNVGQIEISDTYVKYIASLLAKL